MLWNEVLAIVERAQAFGLRTTPSGARLFGHVPHVAPEAWLHIVFAPLLDDAVLERLERDLPVPTHPDFLEFLRLSNGLDLFSCALCLYGRRTSYARTGDDTRQPFCLMTANTLERPKSAKKWQLIIGGYRNDGSLLSLDTRDGTVFRTKRRSAKVLNRWPTLMTMLRDETVRLAALFDEQGRKLTESTVPTPD